MGKGYCDCKSSKGKSPTIIIPDIVLSEEKWCKNCGQFKLIKHFYANNDHKLQHICKSCEHIRRNINRRKIFEKTGIWPGTRKDKKINK